MANVHKIAAAGGLLIPVISGNPTGTIADGTIWYDTAAAEFKSRQAGSTIALGGGGSDANEISYDNTIFNLLTATDVQEAIDELAAAVDAGVNVNALAGAGLAENTGALDVQVDDTTIEIEANSLQIKSNAFGADLIPATDDQHSLGTTAEQWQNVVARSFLMDAESHQASLSSQQFSHSGPVQFALSSNSGFSFDSAITMQNSKITDLAAPTDNDDAATKEYVDSAISALPSTFDIQGNWNANDNTPTLVSGENDTGATFPLYIVTVAGNTEIDGQSDWQVGDKIYFANGQWYKADNNDAVVSVNNKTGAVVLDAGDIEYDKDVAELLSAETVQAAIDELATDLGAIDTSNFLNKDGSVALDNNAWFTARNAADTDDLDIFKARTDDRIEVGRQLVPSQNNQALGLPTARWQPEFGATGFSTNANPRFAIAPYNTALSLIGNGLASNMQLLGTSNQISGDGLILATSSQAASSNSQNLILATGAQTGSANSGNIRLFTGLINTGTRGSIRFEDGSEGTVGHVWTSKGTNGEGNWESLDAEDIPYDNTVSDLTATDVQAAIDELAADLDAIDTGANTTLSNLTSPTSINQALLPDASWTRNLGSSSDRWNQAFVSQLNSDDGSGESTFYRGAELSHNHSTNPYTFTTNQRFVFDATVDMGENLLERVGTVRRGASTEFYEEVYVDQLLLTQSTTAVASELTFAHAEFEAVHIEYKIKDETAPEVRTGKLLVATNGTNVSITDMSTETGDVGVTWSAAINGANVELSYTTTANNKTMRAMVKKIRA